MKNKENSKIDIMAEYRKLENEKSFYKIATNKLMTKMPKMKALNIFTDFGIELNNIEFYWLVQTYNQLILELKLENYKEFKYDFTDREIEEAELFNKIESKEIDAMTINIQKIDEVVEDYEYCSTKVTAGDLTKIFNFVSWNPFSQREVTVKSTGINVVKLPTIYRANVESIKQKMRDGEFKSNMISLNILKTDSDTEEYSYDKHARILSFTKARGSFLDCVDGFHRLTAISELINEDPSYSDKIHMQLKIWHMDINEAADFVNQEASGTAIKIEKKEISKNDLYNNLINELAKEGNSKKNALKDKFGEEVEVSIGDKIFTYELFRYSLEDNMQIENAAESRKLKKILSDCWNEIIFNNEDLFINFNESKKENALTNNNILCFFNYIITEEFMKKESKNNILEKIDLILENIDFDLTNNKIWNELHITSGRYPKSYRVNIYKYAKKVINEVN